MATKKAKKGAWFYKVRGSYLPKSWQGISLYLMYVAFVVGVFVYAYGQGDDIWSIVFMVFPQWIAAVVVMHYIASLKS